MDEAELYLYLRIQHVSVALGCWRVVIQCNPKSELACERGSLPQKGHRPDAGAISTHGARSKDSPVILALTSMQLFLFYIPS